MTRLVALEDHDHSQPDSGMVRPTVGAWEGVGPFPAGMREHPLMAGPLAAFERKAGADPEVAFAFTPYGEGDWPSELPTGGRAGWARFNEENDVVKVSYPDVRWEQLRADHGWASLQYTCLLRREVTIPATKTGANLTQVRVDMMQAVEYAFIPEHADPSFTPTWYAGDVYAFGSTPSGKPYGDDYPTWFPSNYARSITLAPGKYILLVRALYECRMFGDPHGEPPTIRITCRINVGGPEGAHLAYDAPLAPDVLDGWVWGRWASLHVRCPPGAKAVDVSAEGYADNLTATILRDVHIEPGQTRCLPLLLVQLGPTTSKHLDVKVTLEDADGTRREIRRRIDLVHRTAKEYKSVLMTYGCKADEVNLTGSVSSASVLPPKEPSSGPLPPVLLALHGAGVPTPNEDWVEAMPAAPGMWAVLPSGRTEWGEDWHGGSLEDVWSARDEFDHLCKRAGLEVSTETLLIGHSNGGQGAWHSAARYPDRIRGIIAVAGYLKIQDYVPYTETTSGHYADPALLGVMNAALAPYNNDLYASNLASVPVLAVHGADDDNVPPRHGRAHAVIVASWVGEADVRFIEVPHVGHVWDGVLRHPAILEFINKLPPQRTVDEVRNRGFTLATANPDETGSKAGIRIAELATPGRLARLDVNAPHWRSEPERPKGTAKTTPPLDLHGTNVRRVEVRGWGKQGEPGCDVQTLQWEPRKREWHVAEPQVSDEVRVYGPMIRLLGSLLPVVLVLPDGGADDEAHARDVATRYAHDLRVYHRMDSELITATQALRRVATGFFPGNIIVFGRPDQNLFAEWMLVQKHIPVSFPTRGVLDVAGRTVWERGTGIATLHPHPVHRGQRGRDNLAALVAGNDAAGLEAAARMLPLRTGVPVPDWIVVGPRMRWQAAGGVIGAGFWDARWGWSESMSWFDRE